MTLVLCPQHSPQTLIFVSDTPKKNNPSCTDTSILHLHNMVEFTNIYKIIYKFIVSVDRFTTTNIFPSEIIQNIYKLFKINLLLNKDILF